MGKITLIIGGARSGKSSYAQQLAKNRGLSVGYVATAQALDEEMTARIDVHRKDRPFEWFTYEIPMHVGEELGKIKISAGIVILDCLTLLITNRLLSACGSIEIPDEKIAKQEIESEIFELIQFMELSDNEWIVVSNEVGLGVVPPYPLGRIYRDFQGWANQRIAQLSTDIFWMVAGIPVPIHQYK